MLWGAAQGALELRRENGSVRLAGRFPYATETELAPGRAETIEARAFAPRIEANEDVHLLAGHDYDKPLASRHAGTLQLRDTAEALEFEATLSDATSWARDFLAAHAAGLIRGLSPGFRVPAGGERIEKRGNGLLRRIERADLYELSAVTVPAYGQAQIEARAWEQTANLRFESGLRRTLNRWRA